MDLGCGSVVQTRMLVCLTAAHIIVVNVYQPHFDKIDAWAEENGVAERVRTQNARIEDLPFRHRNSVSSGLKGLLT